MLYFVLFGLYLPEVLHVELLEVVIVGQIYEVGEGCFEFSYSLVADLLWTHYLDRLYSV